MFIVYWWSGFRYNDPIYVNELTISRPNRDKKLVPIPDAPLTGVWALIFQVSAQPGHRLEFFACECETLAISHFTGKLK